MKTPNPLLKKLGFANTDRLAILHADDVGMCQSSLTALADLVDFGLLSSAATIVPSGWFPSVAKYCREHPNVDMGVHTTLNCEWSTYRWGALSTCDPSSGLLDSEGYLHKQPAATYQHATAEEVQAEIQAQVQRALAAGMDITHIDTHMGTVVHPKFVAGYIQLALQHRVPAMLPRLDADQLLNMGFDPDVAATEAAFIQQLEAQEFPMVDRFASMPLDQPENQVEIAKKLLGELPAGITHFILHPAADTPELRALAPTDGPSRAANYRAFLSEELRQFVRNAGIQVIGYRALRNWMRNST